VNKNSPLQTYIQTTYKQLSGQMRQINCCS